MNSPPVPNAPKESKREIPAAAARLLAETNRALRQQRPDLARQALTRALELAPEQGDAWRMLGRIQRTSGRYAEAVVSLKRAIEIDPDEAATHMGLGIALHECGLPDEALAEFERACQLAPGSAACWFNMGRALKLRDHRTDKACDALERAVALDPGHIRARLALADVQTSLGRIDAAVANYREILRRQPSSHHAWLALANTKTEKFTAQETTLLRNLLHKAEPASEAGIVLGFALTRALEDQGDYRAAFAVLAEANASKRRTLDWNAASEKAYLDAIEAAFAQPLGPATTANNRGNEVVFVVSLPRSGSTLVEQILASHPQLEGAGEVLDLQQVLEGESVRRGQPFPQWTPDASQADWARLGEEYLRRTAHWRSDKPRFTDKNLLNWKLVGAALAMLPGARVVNCRRDPLETCLGCYRQLFRTGNGFSYALEEMAAYWRLYDRLCMHWQRLYPERFLGLRYESLVAQPEAEVRRLLEFCGLAFDPACLDFHQTRRTVRTASAAQVRRSLHRNTARGDRYGDALAPLRALLANDAA
jgi:Tfp pilus assembly protein PilF